MRKKIKKVLVETDKKTLIVYFVLRILVILCLIRELVNGNLENALTCILALILFLVPSFLEKTLKILELNISIGISIIWALSIIR